MFIKKRHIHYLYLVAHLEYLFLYLVSESDHGGGAAAAVDVGVGHGLEGFGKAVADLAAARVDAVAPVAGVLDDEAEGAVRERVHGLVPLVADGVDAVGVVVVVGLAAVAEVLVVELPVALVEGRRGVVHEVPAGRGLVARQAAGDVQRVGVVARTVRHDACKQRLLRVVVGQVVAVVVAGGEEVAVVSTHVAHREDVLRKEHVLLLVLLLSKDSNHTHDSCQLCFQITCC